ncbi:YhzD family protein [Fictibacillus iocasae]|uniref:YhzD family protein n=1 Tax=Fictibacillus iocasae TaxID=2715437 RepID=A0ABW2NQZ6_9BACL
MMLSYTLTVYEKNGDKIADEALKANDDKEAKKLGEERLKELNAEEKTHRLTSPKGQLLLFHR